MNRIFVVAVIGPTASGKTALAIELARRLDGEIISADSMQIYKHMDIATAKPNAQELAAAKHHLIGIVEPCEAFSVSKYKQLAQQAIADVVSRGKLPIICGGTGQYIEALLENLVFGEVPSDEKLRDKLNERARVEGGAALLAELEQFDSQAAARLHENDTKRIVRALEIYLLTGKTITQQTAESRLEPSPYRACYIGITAKNRQYLYDRINLRVDRMVEEGLLEEAKAFFSAGYGSTAAQAIGYKEMKPYLDGEMTLEQAKDNLKTETRHYAKRQLTWFRRKENIHWFNSDEMSFEKLVDAAVSTVNDEKGAE